MLITRRYVYLARDFVPMIAGRLVTRWHLVSTWHRQIIGWRPINVLLYPLWFTPLPVRVAKA